MLLNESSIKRKESAVPEPANPESRQRRIRWYEMLAIEVLAILAILLFIR